MASWQSRVVTWLLKRRKRPHTEHTSIEDARARIVKYERFIAHPLSGAHIRPATGAPVPAEWVEPNSVAPARTVLFLHGGAYLFGSPRTHRSMTSFLAREVPARVLVPDYRLAPTHRFPAALDDAVASFRWLRGQGIPAEEIVLAGDSAGGGLVLATLLALRDAGEPLPAAAACMSPWTDLAVTGDSIIECTHSDAWVFGESVSYAAGVYLGDTAPTHPLASPLHGDLAGLPPLLIHASDTEIIRDDSVRFAAKARAAGVPVVFKIWPDMPHVWQGFVQFVPEARASMAEIAAFLAKPPRV